MTVLGIEDPGVWLAYFLCILSAIFCVIYGILQWNKGDEPIRSEDVKWVKDEKKVEEEL
ncbi:MAG: symporter small accessory protein [Candidatus Omnitrophota bacterium]